MQKPESPVDAVHSVLARKFGILNPSNVSVMMLIDAVRDTTPPPREVTIGMLSKILQSLDPSEAVDAWTWRSAQEIVKILSGRPEVQRVAELVDDERLWCTLEGTIAGMLVRVCRGLDLNVLPSERELPPATPGQPGRDQPAMQPEPAERDTGPGGA